MRAVEDREVAEQLGARIRAAREEADMSQEALAAAAGVNRAGLGKIERGEVRTQVITLMRIAGALGRGPCDLMPEMRWKSTKMIGHWE